MRRYWDALLAYPRFLGAIKPSLRGETPTQIETRLAAISAQLWPKRLKAPLGRRILAFSPHPDDEIIGAGGLLLAHRSKASLAVVTVFNGDAGGALMEEGKDKSATPQELAAARDLEIRSVCGQLGATYLGCLGHSDGAPPEQVLQSCDNLRAMVRDFDPDIVIMPSMFDRHDDHRNANLLWALACFDHHCMVLGSEIWTLIQPNAYFEFTEHLEEKMSLISLFKTQTATIDYVDMSRAMAKVRAFHEGSGRTRRTAAEAYFALPNREYCSFAQVMCGQTDDRPLLAP